MGHEDRSWLKWVVGVVKVGHGVSHGDRSGLKWVVVWLK